MRKDKRKRLLGLCLLLTQFSVVFAEEPFVFQNVRSMGMGGILSQNPAMLTEIKQRAINSAISYQDYSWNATGVNSNLSHIGFLTSYAQPNLGISFNYWRRGDKNGCEVMDEQGNILGRAMDSSNETCFLLGVGKQILPSTSIGANIKYLRSSLDGTFETMVEEMNPELYRKWCIDNDQAVSFDVGVLFNPISQVKIVSTFYNALSSKIDYRVYDDWSSNYNVAQGLPKNLALGVNFSANNKILLSASSSHLLEEKVRCKGENYQFKRIISLGIEVIPIPYLFIRAGIMKTTVPSHHFENNTKYHYVGRNIPTVGFGYRYKHIEIDFAGIFENRKKDIEEFSTVSDVTSTFRYLSGARWRF